MQRTAVGIETNEEAVRILACSVVNEETVTGPDVDGDSILVSSNPLAEGRSVQLSGGFTAN